MTLSFRSHACSIQVITYSSAIKACSQPLQAGGQKASEYVETWFGEDNSGDCSELFFGWGLRTDECIKASVFDTRTSSQGLRRSALIRDGWETYPRHVRCIAT